MPQQHRNNKLFRDFSHLLAAGNIVDAIPADQKLCSYLYASLKGIHGVINCRVCLFTQVKAYGLQPDDHCAGCTFFDHEGSCKNRTAGKNIVFKLSTLSRNYAFVTLKVNDDFFSELMPAIQNLANITAISIENNLQTDILRRNNSELRDHELELTRKVRERTLELHESNQELLKTVAILDEAQSIVNIGHWELDLVNGELFWSDEVYRIFGLTKKFIPSFDAFMAKVYKADKEIVQKTFEESIRTKSSYIIEHRIICSGKIKHVQENGKIYYDENGNPVRAVGMLLDISERKKNERIITKNRRDLERQNKIYEKLNDALITKNKEYEAIVRELKVANNRIKSINDQLVISSKKALESDRLKTAFLNNMSHEIRTPMNAIIGFSELLPERLSEKDKVETFVDIIIQRGNDLLRIVDDILDISKIESGVLPIIPESFNILDFFDDLKLVFSEERMRYGKVHLPFIIDIEEPLMHLSIVADKLKLKQIFYNLIGNAFKFTDNGNIIAGCKSSKEHGILFFVQDSGPGISPEKQDIIFHPFVQLEADNSRLFGGTGLGLSIVKGIIKLLEGNIWLESMPVKGSRFFFHIKHKISSSANLTEHEARQQYHIKFEEKKILVVDDDDYSKMLISEILSSTGVNLVFSACGSEAITAAKNESPDLILIDICLPDIQGYEVVKSILKNDPSSKIIAHTAYAGSFDRRKALEAGCVGHLGKPLKPHSLIEAIAKNIG